MTSNMGYGLENAVFSFDDRPYRSLSHFDGNDTVVLVVRLDGRTFLESVVWRYQYSVTSSLSLLVNKNKMRRVCSRKPRHSPPGASPDPVIGVRDAPPETEDGTRRAATRGATRSRIVGGERSLGRRQPQALGTCTTSEDSHAVRCSVFRLPRDPFWRAGVKALGGCCLEGVQVSEHPCCVAGILSTLVFV